MTRNEAIKKVEYRNSPREGMFADAIVDSLEALGVLKLDEPKTPAQRLFEVLSPEFDLSFLLFALDRTGLKIVEKD